MGGKAIIAALVGGGAAYYAWQSDKEKESGGPEVEGIDPEDLETDGFEGIDLDDLPPREEPHGEE